jgi:hypothetical protein
MHSHLIKMMQKQGMRSKHDGVHEQEQDKQPLEGNCRPRRSQESKPTRIDEHVVPKWMQADNENACLQQVIQTVSVSKH